MKNKYLKVLTRFCYGLFYYKEQFRFCINFDRVMKITLAVITASSVASWKIWERFSIVWAVIIGISQVLLIISALLPFKDRITKLRELRVKLADIFEDMENMWFDVCAGKLSEAKINDAISDFKERWRKAEAKYMKDDILPRWGWMIKKSKDYTVAYIKEIIIESDLDVDSIKEESPSTLNKKPELVVKVKDEGIEKITSSILSRLPERIVNSEDPCVVATENADRT